jgi:hypothetical protein
VVCYRRHRRSGRTRETVSPARAEAEAAGVVLADPRGTRPRRPAKSLQLPPTVLIEERAEEDEAAGERAVEVEG